MNIIRYATDDDEDNIQSNESNFIVSNSNNKGLSDEIRKISESEYCFCCRRRLTPDVNSLRPTIHNIIIPNNKNDELVVVDQNWNLYRVKRIFTCLCSQYCESILSKVIDDPPPEYQLSYYDECPTCQTRYPHRYYVTGGKIVCNYKCLGDDSSNKPITKYRALIRPSIMNVMIFLSGKIEKNRSIFFDLPTYILVYIFSMVINDDPVWCDFIRCNLQRPITLDAKIKCLVNINSRFEIILQHDHYKKSRDGEILNKEGFIKDAITCLQYESDIRQWKPKEILDAEKKKYRDKKKREKELTTTKKEKFHIEVSRCNVIQPYYKQCYLSIYYETLFLSQTF